MIFLIFALIVQAATMIMDELHFHFKRGLPRWEKIGHPLDTLTVLFVFLLLIFFKLPAEVDKVSVLVIGAMVFSSLFVTKDEWVHSKQCTPGENWLHSIQFLVHPTVFFLSWNV